jgi:hypothetical protein
MRHAFLLAFTICGAADPAWPSAADRCEQGEVRAASCQAAEAWVRAGLRPGQVLFLLHCGRAE